MTAAAAQPTAGAPPGAPERLTHAAAAARLRAALDAAPAIGWDVDSTLLYGPHSPALRRYLLRNRQKRHMIVTFRTGSFLDTLPGELYAHGLPLRLFGGVLSVPELLWERWNNTQMRRHRGRLSGPPTADEHVYGHWKAGACHRNGLPVLVDDDLTWTLPGCLHFGVRLLCSTTLFEVV